MRASISLGRIAGIKVGINASVFLIVAILVVGLATGQLPAAYPGRSIVAYVIAAIIAALLFLASLLAHELAHSLVARRNGVEVESIVLWLLGGVAQLRGEAKTPGADFRIAIVGPLTSFVLAIVFGLAAGGVATLGSAGCRSVCWCIWPPPTRCLRCSTSSLPHRWTVVECCGRRCGSSGVTGTQPR